MLAPPYVDPTLSLYEVKPVPALHVNVTLAPLRVEPGVGDVICAPFAAVYV